MTNITEFAGLLSVLVLVICALYSLTSPKKIPIVTYVGIGAIIFGILFYTLG